MTTNSGHTSSQFDNELEALANSVLQMGGMVKSQLQLAIEGLQSGDAALMGRVLDLGYAVNALEVEIDRKCNLILAQRQPEAGDLRMVLAVLKITSNIERIGDQSEQIARRAEMLLREGTLNLPRSADVIRSARFALGMVDESLMAFARSDVTVALHAIRKDKNLNEEHDAITRKLIGCALENPRSISAALDFLFMAKAIERIGDHAKNISEHVIFMVKGCDVRHTSIEEMERHALP